MFHCHEQRFVTSKRKTDSSDFNWADLADMTVLKKF